NFSDDTAMVILRYGAQYKLKKLYPQRSARKNINERINQGSLVFSSTRNWRRFLRVEIISRLSCCSFTPFLIVSFAPCKVYPFSFTRWYINLTFSMSSLVN